jgi:hypothetical protein
VTPGWVAGAIRGRALARRRLGDEGVQALTRLASLPDALRYLADSSYGHRVRGDLDVAGARRAIAETSLWHLRVLTGWLPPAGVEIVRALAGWFELANMEARAATLASQERWQEPSYTLGALFTVWPKASGAATLDQLRVVLAHSVWGDPGGNGLREVFLGLRLGWYRRLRAVLPQAGAWADGGLVLALAKARFTGTPSSAPEALPRVPELGTKWRRARDVQELARAVPASGGWVLANVQRPEDLWEAERRWWLRLDADAGALLGRPRLGRTTVVAAATLLITDCWRTQAALEQAAAGAHRDA